MRRDRGAVAVREPGGDGCHRHRRGVRLGVSGSHRQFTFANWPLYIDRAKVNGEQVNPSLELFTQETDIDVDYVEVIQAYDEFFAKLRCCSRRTSPPATT